MKYNKKNFLSNNLIQNFIIFSTIFFYNINLSFSDIIKSSEFLPVNNNLSLFEISAYNYPFINKYLTSTENQQYINKKSGISFGFLKYISDREVAINLNTSNINNKTSYDFNNSQNILTNIDFSIGLKDKFLLKQKWESKIKFLYNGLYDENIECFISDNIVIGGNPESCKIIGKETISNKINGYYKPAIEFDAHLIGVAIDLKNKTYDWFKKDTFRITFQSNYINFDSNINSTLLNFKNDFSSEIPQEDPWIENNLKLSLIRTYPLENNWSVAAGLEALYLNRLNYKKAVYEKDNNSNIKFELRVIKRIKNFYITIGGFNSLNYLLGVEPLLYSNLSHKSFNKQYSQVFINLGKLINSNSETNEKSIEKENPYYKIQRAVQNRKIEMLNISKRNDIENGFINKKNNSDLHEFAISYAKLYDVIIK